MNLYLLKNFNNYYNRIVKKFNKLENYPEAYITKGNVNFVPRDGVSTTCIVNDNKAAECDYLITFDDAGEIVSRWFIIDSDFKRAGQVELTLKRDTIADNWEAVLNSTAYVYKGNVKPNNPLIFNSEGLTYNQIKTSEHLLKRDDDTPWLAIYFTKEFDLSGFKKDGRWQKPYVSATYGGEAWLFQEIEGSTIIADETVPTIAQLPFLDRRNENLISNNNKFTYNIPARMSWDNESDYDFGYMRTQFSADGLDYNDFEFFIDNSATPQVLLYDYEDTLGEINSLMNNNTFINSVIYSLDLNVVNAAEALSLNGKTYYCAENNTYYTYRVEQIESEKELEIESGSSTNIIMDSALYDKGLTTLLQDKAFPKQLSNNESITVTGKFIRVSTQESTTALTPNVYFPICKLDSSLNPAVNGFSNNQHTNEAYDVLVIPYSDFPINGLEGLTKERRLKVASTLIGSESIIKDIQLIPYVPIEYNVVNDRIYITGEYDQAPICKNVTFNAELIDYGFYLRKVSFTKSYEHNITMVDKKISNETDMYRLCSPNYNGVFEFNPAQFTFTNDNNPITTWNVDVTLKPYQPYIHVYPNFDGLYGTNFGDARGLICEGDFSLSRLTDAFTDYALQNKNYDAQFKREIKSMKKQFNWNLAESAASTVTGSVIGGTAGAKFGGVVGGSFGAALGAGEGLLNTIESISLGKDQISLAKDKYNFNLQNIQAIPDTLTKVSAFNQNNKIFPFIEYYTCTDIEKEVLRNKIKYEGMTLNVVGTLEDYIGSIADSTQYIRADIIRIENIGDDYHITNDIANELKRGVYYEL